jgi:hypothetical protein
MGKNIAKTTKITMSKAVRAEVSRLLNCKTSPAKSILEGS